MVLLKPGVQMKLSFAVLAVVLICCATNLNSVFAQDTGPKVIQAPPQKPFIFTPPKGAIGRKEGCLGDKNEFQKAKAQAQKNCPGKRLVWNSMTRAKVYHCEGGRFYGETVNGCYLCEFEARSTQGLQPAKSGNCGLAQD